MKRADRMFGVVVLGGISLTAAGPAAAASARTTDLAGDGLRTVGITWRDRMRQAHLSVGAFALLAGQLAEQGCDPVVLSLVTRASWDAVRHAEICRRYAASLLGEDEVPARLEGSPSLPAHPGATAGDRVLFHVVELCCLGETLGAITLTEMHARATHPMARAAIESLLEGGLDHGRVGWAYLAQRTREHRTRGLAQALPEMLGRMCREALSPSARATDEPGGLEAYGFLARRTGQEVCARALRDVILPGFRELGVDLGPAQAIVRQFR